MRTNDYCHGLDAAAPDAADNYTEGNMDNAAKVHNPKDLYKILDFFRYKVGTTLDAALGTGILRNSITWYVSYLENEGLLQAVSIKRDRTTGYKAKHYSANPALWPQVVVPSATKYPSLFNEEDLL